MNQEIKQSTLPFIVKTPVDSVSQCVITDFFIGEITPDHEFPKSPYFFIDGFAMLFILQGYKTVRINGRTYTLKKGDFVMLPPRMIVQIDPADHTPISRGVILVQNELLKLRVPLDRDILNKVRNHPVMHLQEKDVEILTHYITLLRAEANTNDESSHEEIIQLLLCSLILQISRIYKRVIPDTETLLRSDELTNEFFQHLSVHYKTKRSVAFYADQMHITARHLSRAVQHVTSRSAIEWINYITLLEIQIQLKTTNDAIQDIAFAMEFSSAAALVAFFKKHTGITPLQYRKNDEW